MRLSRPIQQAVDLLLAQVRSIAHSLQNVSDAIHEKNAVEHERQQSPPILRAELEIPAAIRHEKNAQDNRDNRRENWRLFVEIISVFIVLGYTSLAYFQWIGIDRVYRCRV